VSEIAVRRDGADVMEAVITKGDLARLTPQEKTQYYAEVCRSVGLNPFTRPFEYISLSGKLTLYARREATDQLRRMNGISLQVISREVVGDILTVHVRATDKTGRTDEDFGAVSIKGLAGEALSNASMKAITKAKRRVTLSISGLGFLDESELEGIPAHERAAPADTRPQLDAFAGDAVDADALERDGRQVAASGLNALRDWFRALTQPQRNAIGHRIGDLDRPGDLLAIAKQADGSTVSPAGIPSSLAPHTADNVAPAGEPGGGPVRGYDPDTGEVMEPAKPDPVWIADWNALVPKPSADPERMDWLTFAEAACHLLSKASRADLEGLELRKSLHLRRMREEEPDLYRMITAGLSGRARELAGGGQ
jgi:hypothetical protein